MRKWPLVAGIPLCLAIVLLACLHIYAWYCIVLGGQPAHSAEAMGRKYACLNRARACEPDNPGTYYLIGKMYDEIRKKPYLAPHVPGLPKMQNDIRKRALALAIEYFQKANDRDPKNALYLSCRGRACLDVPVQEDESAREKALAALEKAIQLDRSSPLHHYWMGIYYQTGGLLTGAVNKYREAIACDRSYAAQVLKTAWDIDHYPLCLYRIAEGHEQMETALPGFLMEHKATAAARALCIAVCQKADDYAVANQVELLGRLIQLRQPALAKLYALEWSERRPDLPLKLMLVSALEAGGENELAVQKMEEIAKAEDANATSHVRLADLYRNAKRFDDAAREYEAAIQRGPKNPDLYETLARFHWGRQNFASSAQVYERLTKVFPDNPFAHYQVGNARLAMGDVDGALAAFREAVALAPNDDTFKRALARASGLRMEKKKDAKSERKANDGARP